MKVVGRRVKMATLGAHVALGLVVAGCALPAGIPVQPSLQATREGEVVIHWQDNVADPERAALRARHGVTRVNHLTPRSEHWPKTGRTPEALKKELAEETTVKAVLPNPIRYLVSQPVQVPQLRVLQVTGMAAQWHLTKARFPQAWKVSRGKGVIVAVIDSGVDPNHPDLKDNLLPLIDEVVAMGRRDNVDSGRLNFDGRDSHGHGTHVSGLIAARSNASGGVSGGAPEAKILPVKVTPLSGETDDATIAKGIRDAVEQGARVLNLSIGGPEPSPVLLEALNQAMLEGAVPVIAAGNDGGVVNFPAAYPGVVAVGATTDSGRVADYSCRGEGLVLVAPGGGQSSRREGAPLYSTMPTYQAFGSNSARLGTGYGTLAGTSMAAPLVSAAAALVLAVHPEFSSPQVRTRLAAQANERPVQWSPDFGYGNLNAEAALASLGDR
ncbi:MAG: S8 family serine peptidase [Candidatus Sericytochromatia bacterium]|nr:S8 family serine peptidase [Candidatus Sericytochromatia bacterium]